jgi:murein DD-endopeptidase MepM/ murein hydrolase activator NlpD
MAGLEAVAPMAAQAAGVTQLKQKLAAIRAQVSAANRAYEDSVTQLENTQSRVAKTRASIRTENAHLAAAQTRLAMRADAMYRAGGRNGILDFLLGSVTWQDFVTRVDLATVIASSDADLAADVINTRARLARNVRQLGVVASAQAHTTALMKARQAAMDSQLAARQAEYASALASLASAWVSGHPGVSYPPGPNGMVFPVQGVHSYSDTWGAPRSGGRHHMGTDIMSLRGTPCVATVAGTVRPHWNNLGGNSITLSGNDGWTFYYAHLSRYAVHVGQSVKAGQVIGYVGNTGDAAGGPTHLHLQMGPHGNWVDPYPYLRQMEQ